MVEDSVSNQDRRPRVFISYSHQDDGFARNLLNSLLARQIDAYFDERDILPGEPWKERLSQLIVSADAVVLCVSPNFVDSTYCIWELNEADRLGKYLLPVFAAPTPSDDLPERLRSLHRIDIRSPHEFTGGLDKLIDTINTDIAWTREHTRLGELAIRWVNRNRSEALLLRDNELNEAELWLTRIPPHQAQPTELHRDFIHESRRAQQAFADREQERQARTRRLQKRVAWTLAALLLVSVAAFPAAMWWTYRASEREANVFLSRAETAFNQGYCDRALRYAVAGLPPKGATPLIFRSPQLEGALSRYASSCRFHLKLPRMSFGFSLSPKGNLIAAGHRIYNYVNGALLSELHCAKSSYDLQTSFDPTGSKFAIICTDNTVRVWRSVHGALITVLDGHTDYIESVSFSPDGKQILTVSSDKTARIWNSETGEEMHVLRGHSGRLSVGRFSPDGTLVVTASGTHIAGTTEIPFTSDTIARIWDARTGELRYELKEHTRNIEDANFSPDSKHVVTASYDNTARIWDMSNGALVSILKEHQWHVRSAVFDPTGSFVATTSADRTVRLWKVSTGEQLAVLNGHSGNVSKGAFSPDGTQLVTASADKTARIWDIASRKSIAVLRGHDGELNDLAYSADGRWIATAAADGSIRIWHARPRPLSNTRAVGGVVWDYSAIHLGANKVAIVLPKMGIRLYDFRTGKYKTISIDEEHRFIVNVNFSLDGTRMVTSSFDQTARVWNTNTGNVITVLKGHDEPVTHSAFSPDGRYVVSTSRDKTARIWDSATGEELLTLSGHTSWVDYAQFNFDGTQVITASTDTTARIWDTSSGELIRVLKGHKAGLSSATFSPDGKRAVTTSFDSTAIIWELRNGDTVAFLRGHESVVTRALYSPNGRLIATISWDGFARLWDADTGVEIARLHGDERILSLAVFSLDGRRLLTASQRGTSKVWELDEIILMDPSMRRQYVCEKVLRSAQAFTDLEMRDQILVADEGRRNPCLRFGPLSVNFYASIIASFVGDL